MQIDFWQEFWRNLKIQLPYVLAHLLGITLALVYQRRYPRPCFYLFMGCAIKLVVTIAYPLSEAYLLLRGQIELFEISAVVTAVIDASAYGFLFLAIFSGRIRRPPPRFLWPDEMEPDEPAPPPPADSTDIRLRKP